MINRSTRRRGIALWHVSLFFATVVLIAAIFGPMFFNFNSGRSKPERSTLCQSNLKQIMLSVKQYTQDYDGKYPTLASSKEAYGWAGALQVYAKSTQIFQCPAETFDPGTDPIKPSEQQYTDYWMNQRLDGLSTKKIAFPSQLIAFGDGNDGTDATDARYHLGAIPKKWFKEGLPIARHDEGANLGFADGHVKWYAGKSWKTETTTGASSLLLDQ